MQSRTPSADAPGRVEHVVHQRHDGARGVVDAPKRRPAGVPERELSAPNRPAGFNPYFDPPMAA